MWGGVWLTTLFGNPTVQKEYVATFAHVVNVHNHKFDVMLKECIATLAHVGNMREHNFDFTFAAWVATIAHVLNPHGHTFDFDLPFMIELRLKIPKNLMKQIPWELPKSIAFAQKNKSHVEQWENRSRRGRQASSGCI